MLNVGFPELATILVVALLLLGPSKLPEFARWLGRTLRAVRNATQEVKHAIDIELEKGELQKLRSEFQEVKKDLYVNPIQELDHAAHSFIDNNTEDSLKDAYGELQDSLELSKIEMADSPDSVDDNKKPQKTKKEVLSEDELREKQSALPLVAGPPPETLARGSNATMSVRGNSLEVNEEGDDLSLPVEAKPAFATEIRTSRSMNAAEMKQENLPILEVSKDDE